MVPVILLCAKTVDEMLIKAIMNENTSFFMAMVFYKVLTKDYYFSYDKNQLFLFSVLVNYHTAKVRLF
jgi:hypothetical protein